MIKGLFFTIIFLLIAAIAAAFFTPLEFVLKQAGVNRAGVGWASAEGNILQGRINGFFVQSQSVGDVKLKLRPASLLSGRATYDVTWSGAGGRGAGEVSLSSGTVSYENLRAQQQVRSIEGLAPAVRAIGGEVRLADGAGRVTRQGCEEASGTVSSDTLRLAAGQYGKDFGEVSGPISCVEGAFVLTLAGRSPSTSDRVTVSASASLLGQTSFVATVETADRDLTFILPQIGFERRGNEWEYRHSANAGVIR